MWAFQRTAIYPNRAHNVQVIVDDQWAFQERRLDVAGFTAFDFVPTDTSASNLLLLV